MAYGSIKVDNIIYTKGGADTTITVSGIVDSLSGAISVTGSISGASVSAPTGTFTTLSGNTTAGTTATFVTGVFTTSLSGATITGNTGQFSTITGVSGVFTTRISGATITGNTGQFSSITGISGVFTSVSGTTFTVTSGVFASGTAAAPSVSVGTTTNGLYSSATNEVALATNSSSRLVVDGSGNVNIDAGTFYVDAVNNRVGIGIPGPSSKLDIVDTTADAVLSVRSGTPFSPSIYFEASGSNSAAIKYDRSSQAITFSNNSSTSERMRITSGGLVGIGTTSPTGQLDVTGSLGTFRVSTSGAEVFFTRNENNDLRANGGSSAALSIGGQSYVRFQTGSGFGEAARFDSSGRLLVGATSDSGGALLQVNGDRIRVGTAKTPASASDTGTTGEVCWDANYIYVCTATNTWKRSTLSTW